MPLLNFEGYRTTNQSTKLKFNMAIFEKLLNDVEGEGVEFDMVVAVSVARVVERFQTAVGDSWKPISSRAMAGSSRERENTGCCHD